MFLIKDTTVPTRLAFTKPFCLLSLLGALGINNAAAQERIEHQGHQHGSALIQIALQGSALNVILTSPSANLLGFEHAATSEQELQTLAQLKRDFAQDLSLLSFNSQAGCKVNQISVEQTFEEHEHHDDEGHDEHHDDKEHNKHHDSEGHNEASEAETTDNPAVVHSEIVAQWRFHCNQPERFKTLQSQLFAKYPTLEKISVEFISDSRQSGATLTAKQPSIDF